MKEADNCIYLKSLLPPNDLQAAKFSNRSSILKKTQAGFSVHAPIMLNNSCIMQ